MKNYIQISEDRTSHSILFACILVDPCYFRIPSRIEF